MRNYWLYFASSAFSLAAINLFLIGQSWHVFKVTGERLSVSTFWVLFMLPGTVLLPRISRWLRQTSLTKSLLFIEIFKALIFIFLGLFYYLTNYRLTIFIETVFLGVTIAPLYPSIYFVLNKIAEESKQIGSKLSNIFEVAIQMSSLVGSLSAGFVYEHLGFRFLLFLCAFFLALSALFIKKIKFEAEPGPAEKANTNELNLIEKFVVLKNSVGLEKTIFAALHVIPQNVIFVLTVPFVIYVSQVMKAGPETLGYIESLFGAVSLVASLYLIRRGVSNKKAFIFILVTGAIALASYAFISPQILAVTVTTIIVAALLNVAKVTARSQVIAIFSKEQMLDVGVLFQTFSGIFLVILSYLSTATFMGASGGFILLAGLILAFAGVVGAIL